MATGQTARNLRVTPSGPSSSSPIERHSSHEQALCDALNTARRAQTLQPLACVEDAVFRYYLPMARSIAHGPDTNDEGPGVDHAAELGLAEAVLASTPRVRRVRQIRQSLDHVPTSRLCARRPAEFWRRRHREVFGVVSLSLTHWGPADQVMHGPPNNSIFSCGSRSSGSEQISWTELTWNFRNSGVRRAGDAPRAVSGQIPSPRPRTPVAEGLHHANAAPSIIAVPPRMSSEQTIRTFQP